VGEDLREIAEARCALWNEWMRCAWGRAVLRKT
jgi:hypothetical protein